MASRGTAASSWLRVVAARMGQHLGAIALLFDAARAHHDDVVGDVLDDTDVVRGEVVSQAWLTQRVKGLGLHRHRRS